MSITWTLRLASTTKTLAAWGVQGVQLDLASLTADQLTFTAPRAAFDDDELCAYGDACELIRTEGGAAETWFIGTRQLLASQADASSQSQTYLFDGPWRWLAENIFQQPWGVAQLYSDHIILNQDIGKSIKNVLDYAIANAGPIFQYVAAELTALAIITPADEITGQLCAEVIRSRLQFTPDAIHWFDYTTTPPTIHFAKRTSLVASSVRLASYTADDTLPKAKIRSLRPRPDLRVPSVKINGETIVTVDGAETLVPSVDIYPPGSTGREDGALNATITLQGRTENNIFGEIECETIDTSSVAWWRRHVAKLQDTDHVEIISGPIALGWRDASGATIASAFAARLDANGNFLSTTYPRQLIDGQIADWMPLDYQTEWIRCAFNLRETDEDGLTVKEHTEYFTIEIVTTDAPAGVSSYSITDTVDLGDPSILGLAQYLYEALNPLHYDGAIELEERECTGLVSMGNRLNLLGSRSEYATMAALIQQISFAIDSGITSITFGPPRHLNLSDILTLLQRFRTRRRWTNPATQQTGELSGTGSTLELGKAVPNTNAIPGAGVTQLQVIKQSQNKVTIDARQARTILSVTGPVSDGAVYIDLADAGGLELRIREVEVCVNNVTKHMRVICSTPY